MEKKQIKLSLGTFIFCIITIILAVIVVIMGIQMSNQNKALEESKIAMENKEKELQEQNVSRDNTNRANTATKVEENNGTELNINDSIVQNLIRKIGSEHEKEQALDEILRVGNFDKNNIPNDLILKLGFLSVNLDDRKFRDNVMDYIGTDLVPYISTIEEMTRETLQKSIRNLFGNNIKYTDETFEMDYTEFATFSNHYLPNPYEKRVVEYKNEIYTTKWDWNLEADGPGGSFVYQNISKALKYNNKIEIYVKIAFADIAEENDEWLHWILYKNYDYNHRQFSQRIIKLPDGDDFSMYEDQFNTYVYTFETDSKDGEYCLSAFSKVE